MPRGRRKETWSNVSYSVEVPGKFKRRNKYVQEKWRAVSGRDEIETGFFNTFAFPPDVFSRGLKKISPAVTMSYWLIFERNLVGLTDFAGSLMQRLIETRPVGHPLEFRACEIGHSH